MRQKKIDEMKADTTSIVASKPVIKEEVEEQYLKVRYKAGYSNGKDVVLGLVVNVFPEYLSNKTKDYIRGFKDALITYIDDKIKS